jgi:hypothetical protein
MTSIPVNGVPSDKKVYSLLQKGLVERGALYVGAGVTAGALASIVLSRGSTTRKVITAFGGGVGLGSAWTRTSMDIEEMLEAKK